ncbi:hypothetical protein ACI2KR_06395 [Pseudomonas luteola]
MNANVFDINPTLASSPAVVQPSLRDILSNHYMERLSPEKAEVAVESHIDAIRKVDLSQLFIIQPLVVIEGCVETAESLSTMLAAIYSSHPCKVIMDVEPDKVDEVTAFIEQLIAKPVASENAKVKEYMEAIIEEASTPFAIIHLNTRNHPDDVKLVMGKANAHARFKEVLMDTLGLEDKELEQAMNDRYWAYAQGAYALKEMTTF